VFAEAAALAAATGISAPGLAELTGNNAEYLVGVSLRDPAGGGTTTCSPWPTPTFAGWPRSRTVLSACE